MNRPKPKIPKVVVKSKRARRIVHGMWPRLVMGQLIGGRAEMAYMIRAHRDAFTEKELKYIEARITQLALIEKDLHKIYYRLKFP